jgi:hypothetical protein
MGRGESSSAGTSRRARAALAAVACLVAGVLVGCSTVDPYEITCRELVTSPDKLRETSFKLAKNDLKAKVRYEEQIERICADAPEDLRPVQRIKPEE